MNTSRFLLVTALGLGLSSTGCLGNTDPLVEDIEPPRFKTLENPGGGVNPNGLTPDIFHSNKQKLANATLSPLLQAGAFSPQLTATNILTAQGGPTTLQYAMQCAILNGTTIEAPGGPYVGKGLLTTGTSWAGALNGLPIQATGDLFSCMLAHLNPSLQHVDILLSGYSVRNQAVMNPMEQAKQDLFSFDEALWTVTGTTVNTLVLHVWPLGDLMKSCGRPNVIPSLQTRVCGFVGPNPAVNCGVNFHVTLDADCDESGGHYTCLGQPAIRTRLKPWDVSTLHGGCGL